ncbi:hypothetical protein QWJ34_02780 [Saccharibacillus sp. CPCC 101409]|uniref:hypothetical protein n=1 Tax=Saccharibacillus sp. CPCC 101409 TaxID=3058041 RepID=UPI002670F107|nr:hypothetical protein [Saccharibacillus sp. CPCC 101409]MDO3408684.1 hypothetical protein [Saccharibacillus sp. CPCC 101409]
MWLVNPAETFSDPTFRFVWLLELIVLLALIVTAMRFTRRAWISAAVLLGIGLLATLPGLVYRLFNPDPQGALIDIPLLFMFPLMAVSLVWAIAAWAVRLSRKRTAH